MRRLALTALALLAACGPKAETDHPTPQDFALTLSVTAKGTGVQRLDLPASALLALRRADHGDIRLFDAQSRPLSLALLDTTATQETQARFAAIPLVRKPASRRAPVSVHVEEGQGSVTVDTGGDAQSLDPAALIDTRKVEDPAVALVLDTSLPAQQPVEFTIAAGDDLKTWEPLAEQVLLRPSAESALLGGGRIPLPGAALHGRYLRIAWHGASDAKVTGVTLFTTRTPAPPRQIVPVTGLALVSPHEARFTLPPATSPSAIRVAMTGPDGVVPLRLYGRTDGEAPWTMLAMASLRQGGQGALLNIAATGFHQFKLEADARSAGFSEAPKLELSFAPISLAAAFNDAAPYRLVVGDAAARPAFFAVSELAGGMGPFAQASIIADGPALSLDVSANGAGDRVPTRVIALWMALLLGVAVLIFATWRLMRSMPATKTPEV